MTLAKVCEVRGPLSSFCCPQFSKEGRKTGRKYFTYHSAVLHDKYIPHCG